MNSNLNEILLNRKNLISVNPATDSVDSFEKYLIAATASKNLESLGFRYTHDLIKKLRNSSVEEILKIEEQILSNIESRLGADVTYKPMYPGFPDTVMEKSDFELYLDAMIYAESGFLEEAKLSGELAIDRYLSEGEPVDFEKIIETEHQVYYDLPNGHQFTGIIDAVIQNDDGTVTIVDYKTHSTAPTDDEYRYSLQGNLYMYVYTQLGYNVRDMIFDCVNPKIKLTGRNYKRKTIRLVYNEYRTKDFFDQFVNLVDMIEANPDFKLYIPGKSGHKPDAYDYLYKVYIGEMMEDLDEFIEKNFQKRVDSPTQK